jgi:hypothetical protein
VEEHFEGVFGYALRVDPLNFHGKVVRKSIKNASHDGQIVSLPDRTTIGPTCDYVYEHLINNSFRTFVCDIRVPVILGDVPFAYLKIRPLANRFSNDNTFVKMISPFDVMDMGEFTKILSFCKSIGLEYGELDVLRDYDSGRLFVVDANNTPYGPPNHLSADDADTAICVMANCVIKRFFLT